MRAVLFALMGAICLVAQAQANYDIVAKKQDNCGQTIREKQYCFQRYDCGNGSQYAIAYLLDKSTEKRGAKFVAFCKIENTKGGVDSCRDIPETQDVRDCRKEATEKNIILNQGKAKSSTPKAPRQNGEPEINGATH